MWNNIQTHIFIQENVVVSSKTFSIWVKKTIAKHLATEGNKTPTARLPIGNFESRWLCHSGFST